MMATQQLGSMAHHQPASPRSGSAIDDDDDDEGESHFSDGHNTYEGLSVYGDGTYEGSNSLTSSVVAQDENWTLNSEQTRSTLDGSGGGGGGGGAGSVSIPTRSHQSAQSNSVHSTLESNSLSSSMQMKGHNSVNDVSTMDSRLLSVNELMSLPSSFASSGGESPKIQRRPSQGMHSLEGSHAGPGGNSSGVIGGGGRNSSNNRDDSSRLGDVSDDPNKGRMELYARGDSKETAEGASTLSSSGGTVAVSDQSSAANSEDRLALRISRETKPMMHLLNLLREMEGESFNASGSTIGDAKVNARASLISDFEREVALIEHRIKDETLIMNGEQPPLPPDWIALEDPDSGDIYYANEASGETQWERPGLMDELKGRLDVVKNGMNTSSNNLGGSNADFGGSNGSNNFNQSNRSNDFSGSNRSNNFNGSNQIAASQASNNFNGSNHSINSGQQQQQQQQMDNYNRNEGSFDGSASLTFDSSLTSSNADENLPPGWIILEDPDSGERYYANEVTGESTWDRPATQKRIMPKDSSNANSSGDNNASVEEGDLPPDWVALEDADSGDTYYLNQVTMETTWDRPRQDGAEDSTVEDSTLEDSTVNDSNNGSVDDLPPGWEAILDPDSGDVYYAHESGETQWNRPEFDQTDDEETNTAGDSSAGQSSAPTDGDSHDVSEEDDNLPAGWFAAVDENSGDKYYCNEVTGETTWDFPTNQLALDSSVDDSEPSNQDTTDDGYGTVEEESENNDDLPEGWFAVQDPGSGDSYYVHEESGETTWDRPTSSAGVSDIDISKLSINENPSVYEDDSVDDSHR